MVRAVDKQHVRNVTHTERDRSHVLVSEPIQIQTSNVRMLDRHAEWKEK
jgi:hypothetical protein